MQGPQDFDRVYPKLYQGGKVYPDHPYLPFSMIVLCALEHQAELRRFHGKVVHAPFNDGPLTAAELRVAQAAARKVYDHVRHGGRALVTCYAGMNRSGLVVGLAMNHITQWPPDQIVSAIRIARAKAARDIGYPKALHNQTFVDAIARHSNHRPSSSGAHRRAS